MVTERGISTGDWCGAFVAVAALCTLGGAFAHGDTAALGMISAAVMAPVLIYGIVQCALWRQRYALPATVTLIVLLCATFRIRDITDKTIDMQILFRLGALAGMAAMSLMVVGRGALAFRSSILAVWGLVIGYNIFTSLYSLTPSVSFVETMSGLIGFAFLLAIRRVLGTDGLTRILIWSAWVLCLMSIVLYIVDPSVGRMADWINGAFVPTSRLTGVFGTSNSAGASAAMGLLLTMLLSDLSWKRPIFFIAIAPMLICLVLSNNRMAMFAVLLALVYANVAKSPSALKIFSLVFLAALAALAFTLFGDTILEDLSRSGSADEITSGTGRTRIWAVVLDLWSQRPIFGYGEGSARLILPVHPLLFKAAAHAHSLYLNELFSGGVIGFGLLLTGILGCLKRAVSRRNNELVALLAFQMVYGLTEPTIGGLISFPALSFYAVMVLIGDAGCGEAGQRLNNIFPPPRLARAGVIGLS